ncbi:LppU/SCO3897 family protein [Micromonospora auratinigra]|uniref:LppU/SCO3897 family protein n=1 Tax=Micromonospora auratinigra TaxID=261654 RepID=UPI0038B23DAB
MPGQRHEPQPGWAPPVPGPPGPGYPGPGPERPKRGRVPLLVVLAVVLVLVLGAAAVFWGVSREGGRPSDEPVASAPPAAEPTVATTGPTATPAPASSTDPRFVKTGQCVRNDGGAAQPKLAIAECGPQTYQVVRRFDGATSGKRDAEAKCAKVPGYTDWYFFDSELDTLDFVLCLKRR